MTPDPADRAASVEPERKAPPAPVAMTRPRRRWGRIALWILGVLLLLTLLAWQALPRVLRWQGEVRLSELLGRQVTIGAVEFRPWSLELTVRDVAVAGLAGQPPQARFSRLYVNVQASSVWKLAPVVESAELDQPALRLARLGDGHYDVDDLIAKFTPAPGTPPSQRPLQFSLNNLQVRDGSFDFDDRPVGRQHRLEKLQLSLPFVSNLPADLEVKVQPRLAFVLNGAAFDTGAQATPFAKDRESALQIQVGDGAQGELDLAPYLGYLPKTLPVRLVQGRVAAQLNVNFELLPDGTPSLGLKGLVRAGDVALTDAAGAPLASFVKLAVPLVDVQPLRGLVHLGDVQLDGAALAVARDAAGELNLQRLAAGAPASTPAAATSASDAASAASPAAAPAPAWRVQVDGFALNGAHVDWSDADVSPAAALRLADIQLSAQGLRWPQPEPVPVKLSAVLRQPGGDAATLARIDVDGTANDQAAKLQLAVEGFALPAVAPYASLFLVPRAEGRLDLKAGVDWAAGDAPRLKLEVAEATLAGLRLVDPTPARGKAGGEALSLKQLILRDTAIDVPAQRVSVGSLALQSPQVNVARDAQGRWNVLQWQVAAPKSAQAVPASAAAPAAPSGWQVQLADFKLDGGRIGYVDARPSANRSAQTVRVQLDGLMLGVQGFAYDDRGNAKNVAPAKLQFATNLVHGADAVDRNTRAARIEWRGQVGLQPMLAQGTARVERFPVHAFEAYADNPLRIGLQRAFASYRGEVAFRDTGRGYGASASGEARISDLSLLAQPATPGAQPEELLTWRSLALRDLKFAMEPTAKPSLSIGEVALNDFYSRLVVTEQGRLNLQDVTAKGDAAPAAAEAPASAPAAGSPGNPEFATGGATAAVPPREGGLPIDLSIGGVKLDEGRIDFSDHFIRPNYSAALTQLSGSLGAFRSGSREMATLDLRGRAEGSALLEISGKLNPTADPLALDIRAKATDLELAPLSPYAAKYAGYDIERGKLSMDVSYLIQPDGRLDAKNQVILNQLTFGNKVESPTATKLPVLLAVALLKDRNGIIDIDLPISGSLNDPQFSVGGLIVKVIFNLIGKALTAPFSLLAGGGGKDDLSTIDFRPGTAQLGSGDTATIDRVAKALADRPALRMTVTGASDLAAEREAYQRAALEQRLVAARKREMARNGSAADAPVTMNAADRQRLLEQVYGETKLEDKPRNLLGFAKEIPAAQMESMLAAAIPVNGDTMRELALQRGLAVRDALIGKGLPSDRLFIAAPKLDAAGDQKDWKPSVQLTLSAR